ncbi:MAG: class I tRNA ligase family protein [Planctomyces sp.]|nr:class I tRNA ligase family protein [Planctomyces sp.]
MFQKADDPNFILGEHEVLRFWSERDVFHRLQRKNAGGPRWSFLDGPITANNPMGVHHAWGRTYKDAFQRYFAMLGRDQRFQNGFDCQGLWVEVEVEKELQLGTKRAIEEYGIDRFVRACKQRVLRFAARQTEQSIRLGYWMEWDDPDELRKLAEAIGSDTPVSYTTARGQQVSAPAEDVVARLGNPEWGGSYFTFSTENNETIWAFLKKCFNRRKIYQGHDVMPWSGRGGSAYSQMEVADGRRLTVHRSCFVRFPITSKPAALSETSPVDTSGADSARGDKPPGSEGEYLLIWTTTPWTLTSNVAAAVNPDLTYVRVRAKRDGAVYYLAKDNLESKRMEREFKEGFGRPEWQWPEGVPKLKTLAQIFKEQGGYEVEGELLGREMVGWRYAGPFDELKAQQTPGGFPPARIQDLPPDVSQQLLGWDALQGDASPGAPAALESHRVIDGGRDSKGSPNVTAGEGTGIVHIAPGCGDIDHKIGVELGLPIIAPLKEDGTFDDGFGPFTGRSSIDPATAQLVFDSLKEQGLLVYVEQYPHIYPHCWRTGDELVFRLVDEWFINMDWRDEIKDVTRAIEWLPESLQGQERELDWLTTMRDWMISKKRFWGLALPIWVNPDDPTDFEVMGSLAELKQRAIEGWEELEGHTPHRPWIDRVKIRSERTGATLTRVQDVGNPWLDAGIVPFSTLNYNERFSRDLLNWSDWYPADLVTESFPGQFRNWFYSLLALATMMRFQERGAAPNDPPITDPERKKPFRKLFGYRLVMNEEGKPMHKSDGTAIWFEEAAEQLGVDALRWLYLSQNPAQDLRFGTRHPDQPVTVPTPDGPIAETKEGVPVCRVTSKPVDEVRRQVLIPLWNSYAFFVNYARLDGFDPGLPTVPAAERPEIDRWLLSNLQSLIADCRSGFEAFDTARVCRAAEAFIDDLSNWYIRRNRRRFWRSRSEPGAGAAWDADKLAAYQTLYETLVTLTKLLAPCVPFLSERMHQNLVVAAGGADAPDSVHLCDYPQVDPALLDESLNHRMATAQRVVTMGHRLRETADRRVRQPLAELRYAAASPQDADDISRLADVIADELNVKQLTRRDNLDDLVRYSYKPNLKTLGPKLGKLLNAVRTQLPALPEASLAPLRRGESVTVTIDGQPVTLAPEDVLATTEQATDWACADDAGVQIALSTVLTDGLVREGAARDFIRQVQQLRKDLDLDENERIAIVWSGGEQASLARALDEWRDAIQSETRADRIEQRPDVTGKTVPVGDADITLAIARA